MPILVLFPFGLSRWCHFIFFVISFSSLIPAFFHYSFFRPHNLVLLLWFFLQFHFLHTIFSCIESFLLLFLANLNVLVLRAHIQLNWVHYQRCRKFRLFWRTMRANLSCLVRVRMYTNEKSIIMQNSPQFKSTQNFFYLYFALRL